MFFPWLLMLLLLLLVIFAAIIGVRHQPTPNDVVVADAVYNTLSAPDFVAEAHTKYFPTSNYFYPVITRFKAPHTFDQTNGGDSLRPQGYTLSEFDHQFTKYPNGWTKDGIFYEWSGSEDLDTVRVSFEIQKGYLVAASWYERFFASSDGVKVNLYFERIGKWNVPQSTSFDPVD